MAVCGSRDSARMRCLRRVPSIIGCGLPTCEFIGAHVHKGVFQAVIRICQFMFRVKRSIGIHVDPGLPEDLLGLVTERAAGK